MRWQKQEHPPTFLGERPGCKQHRVCLWILQRASCNGGSKREVFAKKRDDIIQKYSAQPAVWEGGVGCACTQARGDCCHFAQVKSDIYCSTRFIVLNFSLEEFPCRAGAGGPGQMVMAIGKSFLKGQKDP